jgi:hypothetical protein
LIFAGVNLLPLATIRPGQASSVGTLKWDVLRMRWNWPVRTRDVLDEFKQAIAPAGCTPVIEKE